MSEPKRKTQSQVFRETLLMLALIAIAVIWIICFIALTPPSEARDAFGFAVGLTGVAIWITIAFLKADEYSHAKYDC